MNVSQLLTRTTCLAHHKRVYIVTLTTHGDPIHFEAPMTGDFLSFPPTSLLDPNNLTLFSNTLKLYSILRVR